MRPRKGAIMGSLGAGQEGERAGPEKGIWAKVAEDERENLVFELVAGSNYARGQVIPPLLDH